MKIHMTGDTHGVFERIEKWCREHACTKDDLMVIMGDAGINFLGYYHDREKKAFLQSLPITFLCIHGNHEMRPESLDYYELTDWQNGKVWVEKDYPNILFAKDGEVYDLNGLKVLVVGGAYSVDKYYRIIYRMPWFEDEQPSEKIKKEVEDALEKHHWKVDVVLSHTTPLKYEPREVFLPGLDQSTVDKSTENWLDFIEDRLDYQHWYCGHYHTVKEIDKMHFLYENYVELPYSDNV